MTKVRVAGVRQRKPEVGRMARIFMFAGYGPAAIVVAAIACQPEGWRDSAHAQCHKPGHRLNGRTRLIGSLDSTVEQWPGSFLIECGIVLSAFLAS